MTTINPGVLDVGVGKISVVVIDDQQIVLAGVAALVGAEDDMRVVGTAASVGQGVDVITASSPDIVLCDIQLGAESGLALLDHFPAGRPAIVLLSAFEHASYYRAAAERGAAGYVLKGALVDQLVNAIRTVASGGLVFPTHALRGGSVAMRPPSRRELEVVLLVAGGASNDEIGARLGISAKTVDSHLRALFDRYGVVSRTDLAMRAVAEGWLRSSVSPERTGSSSRWMIEEQIVRTR